MKRIVSFLAACLSLAGAELADFGKLAPDELHLPLRDKGQSCESAPAAGRPALKLEWNCTEARWCTVQFRKPVLLPDAEKVQFSLELYREKESSVRRASLFIVDRDGETFQLVADLPSAAGAWETVKFDFDRANLKANVWGGRVQNRVPDPPLRLQGVSCSFTAQHGIGGAALGKLALVPEKAKIEITLETGDDLNLVIPGRESELRLKLHNPGLLAQEADLEYLVCDPDGEELLRKQVPVKLAGTGTCDIPLPRPEQFGVYTVRFQADGGNLFQQRLHRYAYLQPAGPLPGKPGGFVFGICAHPQRYPAADRRRMMRAASLCGAKLVRSALESHRLEPRQGEWNFDIYDDIVRLCRENDLEFAPIFLGMPAWATAKDWVPAVKNNSPRGQRPDYRHWEEFVRKVAERYRADLHYAEVWNEPDLIPFANFSPGEYLEILKITSRALRETVPGITLFSAGFATPDLNPPGRSADPDYVRKCVEGGRQYYDLFAVHMHSTPAHYRAQVEKLLAFREKLKDDTPWYANETAIASIGEISEQMQAETLFHNLFTAWSNGAVGYNWYNLRNIKEDPGDSEANYGMLTRDLQPKPVYAAYNMLTTCFRGAQLVAKAENALVFRAADGSYLIPHWREEGTSGNTLLLFTGVDGDASVIDLWGNVTKTAGRDGVVLLENRGRPAVLRVAGQAAPPVPVGNFLRFDSGLRLFPGRKVTASYECRNPSSAPLAVKVELPSTPELAISPAARTVTIPPGGKAALTFDFAPVKEYRACPVPVTVSVGNLWQGTLDLLPRSVISIPAGKFNLEPEFKLNHPDQVQSLVPVEGSFAHLQWKGPEDLSAELRLARNERELLLEIIVRDDIHHQPHSGREVWQGDNVQLGMKLPRQNGQWEFGFTHLADNTPEVYTWMTPEGYDAAQAAGQIRLNTRRDENTKQTVYEAAIPFRAIGLTEGIGKEGFQLNLMINDNDGSGRESCISAAPGMLSKDSSTFPVFCL